MDSEQDHRQDGEQEQGRDSEVSGTQQYSAVLQHRPPPTGLDSPMDTLDWPTEAEGPMWHW